MAENRLTKLSLVGQLGVAGFVAALILALFWFLYWRDADTEENTKRANLETLQKDIRALEVTANKLQDFQREVQQLEQKLETLKRILPPEKETPDLIRKIQALASQSNLAIKRFNPSAPVNKDFYQELPINIDVEGTYHNLGFFFDRVRRLTRLVNVGNLKIKSLGAQTVSRTIGVSCVATTFVYLEAPTPAPKPPGRP